MNITIYNPLKSKESHDFPYLGRPEGIRLVPGTYKFECWGGAGGGNPVSPHTSPSSGGMGGYTSCVMKITSEIIVYAFVGGAGYYGGYTRGGWNGGGNGGQNNHGSGSGGGGTDFRVLINSNVIYNISPGYGPSIQSRFCVAGGGGGADNEGGSLNGGDDGSGGSGGGINSQGYWASGLYDSYGAAGQNYGNAMWEGESASRHTIDSGGAGGGWYGGRCSNDNQGGAGGGSSYIKGYPGCNTDYINQQGASIFYVKDGIMSQNANYGNGKARITCISSVKFNMVYKNCLGDKSQIEYGEIATATISCAENEYFISWDITDGYSFYSITPTQVKFKAPLLTNASNVTVTITGNKGRYADLIPINCTASMWYIKPNIKIRLTATKEKVINNYFNEFVNFFIDKDIFTKTKISDYEIDIMATQLLPYATHYVEAMYTRKRTNSDIYKSSQDTGANYKFLNRQG